MTTIWTLLCGVALGCSALILIANWTIAVRFFLDSSQRSSLIPLVGGVLGAAALGMGPWDSVRRLWWIAPALDWGSGLGLMASPLLYLIHKKRSSRAD